MASYLDQPRPQQRTQLFNTDYEGILRGLQTKTDYWKVGVQQVQSAYEQAAGLQLTGENNKKRLETFMSQADEQLKKAMASDVSMYDNMASAVSIYKPLYKDPELTADNRTTTRYKGIFGQINNWRTREDGKYYSDTNAKDVMNSYMDFKNGVNSGRSATEYEDKVRDYTPYYDYTKESLELLNKCKADSYSSMGAASDPNLFETKTNESLSASKVAGCLGSLSDKAKKQLLIDERVRYHGRPQDLALSWSSIGQQDIKALQKNLVDAKLSLTANQADPKQRQYYTDYIQSLTDQLYAKQSNLAAINQGDYSDVQNNFDQYASQVGTFRQATQFSSAFSYNKESNEYTPNASALQRDRQNFEVRQGNVDFQRDMYRDNVDFQQQTALRTLDNENAIDLKFLDKFGYIPSPEERKGFKAGYFGDSEAMTPQLTTTASELAVNKAGLEVERELSKESEAIVTTNKLAGNNLQNFFEKNSDQKLLDDLGVDPGKTLNINAAQDRQGQISNLRKAIQAYETVERQNRLLPEGQKLPNYKQTSIDALKSYISTIERNEDQLGTINRMHSIAQSKIDKELGSDSQDFNNLVAKERPVSLQTINGQSAIVTPQQVAEAIQTGRSGDLTAVKTREYRSGTSGPEAGPSTPIDVTKYYYKGSEIKAETKGNYSQFIGLTNKIIGQQNKYLERRNEIVNSVYSEAIAEGRNIYGLQGADATKTKAINEEANDLAQRTLKLNNPELWKEKNMAVVGYLRDGRVVVNTGDTKLDQNTILANNGQDVSTGKNNLIAFDAPTLRKYMNISQNQYGLQDNERQRQLKTMFEKNAPVGDFAPIQQTSVYWPSQNKNVRVQIYGSKDQQGRSTYSIQRYDTNGWDNVKQPGYSNLTYEEANQKYREYINTIQKN